MDSYEDKHDGHVLNDKVRIKEGEHKGRKGIVAEAQSEYLSVSIDGDKILVSPEHVTNYSLAARRAWQKIPKKSGRPRSSKPRKKMVSIRVEIESWELLGRAIELGYVSSKEEAVNSWIKEKLEKLFA